MANLHDFDFLEGEWLVENRYLRSRLTGDDVWEEFPARSRMERRLGSLVNVDQRRWAIYWTDSRRAVLTPPVFGFEGDRGLFHGEDWRAVVQSRSSSSGSGSPAGARTGSKRSPSTDGAGRRTG